MKKLVTKVITTYTLDAEEAKLVKYCLDYCYHRITKHGKTFADAHTVDTLRKQFD